MSLVRYRQKRDFSRTPEPAGNGTVVSGHRFVVQKHAASRLHYDFRLELDGVLKSWAVPKGPSVNPQVKALAVEVEDHPIEYGSFEGIIPENEYGGGTVMVWDQGTWEPTGHARRDYHAGQLSFQLHGERLRGAWTLVRMRKDNEKRNNWLLIKRNDAQARSGDPTTFLNRHQRSVVTHRTMEQIARDADRTWSSRTDDAASGPAAEFEVGPLPGARRRAQPTSLKPQLATLVAEVPAGPGWLHELKLDGYRLIAIKTPDGVRCLTRAGNDWTDRFPRIARAIEHLPVQQAILDGEVVCLLPDGRTDFQVLQNSMKAGHTENHVCFLFDLPHCAGYDLTQVPLLERKNLLARLLSAGGRNGPLRYSDHIAGQGDVVLLQACRHGAEGVVSKKATSTYEPRRSRVWLKIKCLNRQEFVIGGWTTPSGSRQHFGALLLGYYDEDRLLSCGRVGTGFTDESLAELGTLLRALEVRTSPFANRLPRSQTRGVHWVKPELVAEVRFAGWTNDGQLRQASFQGLREDKRAHEVRREQTVKPASQPRNSTASVAGVRLTHPDRVLFPEAGLTKIDLANYYVQIESWILPHVARRPLAVVRCPDGRQGACFFQKHILPGMPDAIHGVEVEEKDGTEIYLSVRDLAGLVALAQFGVLEIHPWPARDDLLERPDRIIFDLDPGEGVGWPALVDAARELRELLNGLGLESFVRTTGGKGLHVVIPVLRRSSWDEIKDFAHHIALGMVRRGPDRFLARASKVERQGKIYVDYLRNGRGATAAASYSPRARPHAPVCTPLAWEEMTGRLDPQKFQISTIPKRLAALRRDPWAGFFTIRQHLTRSMQRQANRS